MGYAEVINGFDIDRLARSLYDSRSMSREPITDERWARHAVDFAVTHKMLLTEARQIAAEDEL